MGTCQRGVGAPRRQPTPARQHQRQTDTQTANLSRHKGTRGGPKNELLCSIRRLQQQLGDC